MSLGKRVRQRREDKGIAAAELARRAEISKGYLSEIESGQAPRPSGAVLMRLADALGTTIADLLDKEVRTSSRVISPSLRQFAEDAGLPEQDVQMLSQIRFRGTQPSSPEDWRFLYESIKRSVRGGAG
jgi:transcriptional regulator with XRE-family HTH domain